MMCLWLLLAALSALIFTGCAKGKKSNTKPISEKKAMRPPAPRPVPSREKSKTAKEPTVEEKKSEMGIFPDEPKKEAEKEEKKKTKEAEKEDKKKTKEDEKAADSKQQKPVEQAEGKGDLLPTNDNDTINDVESNWGGGETASKGNDKKKEEAK